MLLLVVSRFHHLLMIRTHAQHVDHQQHTVLNGTHECHILPCCSSTASVRVIKADHDVESLCPGVTYGVVVRTQRRCSFQHGADIKPLGSVVLIG